MELWNIWLNRMGIGIGRSPMHIRHRCVAYEIDQEAVAVLAYQPTAGIKSVEGFAKRFVTTHAAWVMAPTGQKEGA